MDRRRSSHIVPEIYEATIDTGHWDYVMTMIAKLTKSQSACLYYKDKELGFANAVAQYGLEDKMGRDIEHHLDRFDSLFESDAPNSTTPTCYQHSPGAEGGISEDSTLFNHWMKPNDIYYVGGAQFINGPTHKATLAIMRNQEAGAWAEGELRVVNELLPHLKRALSIHSEFTLLKTKQDALLKGLDRLVIGLILYDRHARVVYINPTAESIIEEHPALQVQGDHLLLANAEEDRSLRQTILDTARIDPDDSWKQSVALGITHPDVNSPLPLQVTPMHAHLITSDLDYEGAKVAVFLTDPNLQQPISVDSLVSVYGLTPSEAQVAITLANGHNIDEIAKTSNHSAHTIRSQLKSVFRKTGVSRQSELIKLLLTGPFAQRRRSSEP